MNVLSSKISHLLINFFIAVILLSFIGIDDTRTDDKGSWEEIGRLTVSEGVSYDVLEITEEKKQVQQLKVKVLKASVQLKSIKVVYTDGTSEQRGIVKTIKKGKYTAPFDLIGHYRTIAKIYFIYEAYSENKGAELVVYAKI